MNDEAKRKYENELMEDVARIMEEINHDPELKDILAPEDAHENIWNAIRAKEAEGTEEVLSDENKELIRLGKTYKRRYRSRKYLVLAAAMVLALAFGITSVGGPEKLFETFKRDMLGREQEQINSGEDIKPVENLDEEQVYEEIEETFGFLPVKIDYRPVGVEFQEATIGDEVQGIQMVYGREDAVNIFYLIRPNYRESSLGMDVEDQLLEEYEEVFDGVILYIKKYQVEETAYRWVVQFEYQEVWYSLMLIDMEEAEVNKIIKNLHFF